MTTTWWDPDTTLDAVAGAFIDTAWGDHVKDNLKALFNPPQCRAYNSAVLAVPTITVTALTLNSERYDTDSLHSTSVNTSRLTAVRAGVHPMFGNAIFAGSASGSQRSLLIRLNGATTLAQLDVPRNGAGATAVAIATEYKLAVGDYVELCAYHDVGSNLNVTPEFGMRWAGAG